MSAQTALPAMCAHHRGVYATRTNALRHAVRHPGAGRKALRAEAVLIARQCRECPTPKETR